MGLVKGGAFKGAGELLAFLAFILKGQKHRQLVKRVHLLHKVVKLQ
jgi:hypothetical protein